VADQPADPQPGPGRAARDAAVRSLVDNGIYLLLVVGVTVALTRRDWLARQAMRARRLVDPGPRRTDHLAMAEVRRDISHMEHYGAGEC